MRRWFVLITIRELAFMHTRYTVESQTPLFSRAGWDIFRDRMLIRLDDDRLQLTDVGPDQVWCRMMELELPSRPACAVLRATIIHGDFRTVRSSGHQADLASVALS